MLSAARWPMGWSSGQSNPPPATPAIAQPPVPDGPVARRSRLLGRRVGFRTVSLEVTLFTDPACPFAFSAEPVRLRLAWHYGDQLRWRTRMIVLTLERGEAEKLAEGAPTLQRLHGMPIDPAPYSRPASSEPACRAVVAARLNAPQAEAALLRRLQVRTMLGGLLDDPALLAAAASDVGLDWSALEAWCASAQVEQALQADIEAARSPSPAARALDHKLGGPPERRRYTAPSYEISRDGDGVAATIPGFHPVEAYEAAIANLAPELVRRPKPESVGDVLAWAGQPLATAEVAAIAQLDAAQARAKLSRVARPIPAGSDFYWTAE
jgi:predicted DsbA family dithiol-disulfide isomerase